MAAVGSGEASSEADTRVALVVVSHSLALAEAAVELASQMVAKKPPLFEVAAGIDDGLGTDSMAIAEAITRADTANAGGGVLVLMDLGSAVMSSQMALELLDPAPAGEVFLSRAPLVEGLVGAAVQAASGSPLGRVEKEAVRATTMKTIQLGSPDES